MGLLKKIASFILDIVFVGLPVSIVFWLSLDFLVFNRHFIDKGILNILYYLLPTITGLLLSIIVAVCAKKTGKYTQMVFILLAACYQFVALWTTLCVYCDKNQNLNLNHKIFVWLSILISLVIVSVKNLRRLSLRDIAIVTTVFFVIMVDFCFFEIIADLLLSIRYR
ncbi:hypothetical protein FUA48_07225 [Flavobacterium alkalisoli]|uniref:Uncharacterized protein n=1 Tax=Flavobacterium alkalisoli TaxID=2602769 RepID=A0A5B9FXC2_9FLAO|nr:hypothetical protein [Flavobacterium alkalisoli]QEE49377.1 hypothetical protein FUA48_07225 [Flavobacterium alkalisoli]